MSRTLFLFLFMTAAFAAGAQPTPASDTLTAGVFPSPTGDNPIVLKGATRDLSDLDIRLITLHPGQPFRFTRNDSSDHLIIIRNGNIAFTTDNFTRVFGPGGIALSAAIWPRLINMTAKTDASFYLFSFRSRSGADLNRIKNIIPVHEADWGDLPMKKTDKGESRAIFSQPVTWLKNINMHATTLNPGEISHPQHMHRAEEILLLRSGNVRMHIAGGYIPAKGGDLVFLPSGVPHDLENGPTGRAEYFALQWEP